MTVEDEPVWSVGTEDDNTELLVVEGVLEMVDVMELVLWPVAVAGINEVPPVIATVVNCPLVVKMYSEMVTKAITLEVTVSV